MLFPMPYLYLVMVIIPLIVFTPRLMDIIVPFHFYSKRWTIFIANSLRMLKNAICPGAKVPHKLLPPPGKLPYRANRLAY
jgi:hypothetical protein